MAFPSKQNKQTKPPFLYSNIDKQILSYYTASIVILTVYHHAEALLLPNLLCNINCNIT